MDGRYLSDLYYQLLPNTDGTVRVSTLSPKTKQLVTFNIGTAKLLDIVTSTVEKAIIQHVTPTFSRPSTWYEAWKLLRSGVRLDTRMCWEVSYKGATLVLFPSTVRRCQDVLVDSLESALVDGVLDLIDAAAMPMAKVEDARPVYGHRPSYLSSSEIYQEAVSGNVH